MAETPNFTELKLTPEMHALVNNALVEGHPLVIAVVDPTGQPYLSFRGSLQTYSDTQLSFWLRIPQGHTLSAIQSNPRVALIYRSPKVPLLQFHGRARVTNDPQERDRVFNASPEAERKQDPERKGVAIIIDLTRIEGVLGFDASGPIWCRMAAPARS